MAIEILFFSRFNCRLFTNCCRFHECKFAAILRSKSSIKTHYIWVFLATVTKTLALDSLQGKIVIPLLPLLRLRHFKACWSSHLIDGFLCLCKIKMSSSPTLLRRKISYVIVVPSIKTLSESNLSRKNAKNKAQKLFKGLLRSQFSRKRIFFAHRDDHRPSKTPFKNTCSSVTHTRNENESFLELKTAATLCSVGGSSSAVPIISELNRAASWALSRTTESTVKSFYFNRASRSDVLRA